MNDHTQNLSWPLASKTLVTGRWIALLSFSFLALAAGCSSPAEQRVIPAELAPEERAAHRKLKFDGADNFRDLGGYKTADGRRVKWGLVYRSDALSDVSDEDQLFLQRLGLAQVVDFRTEYEKSEDPDRIPADINYVERPVDVEGTAIKQLFEKIASGDLEDFDAVDILVKANIGFVRAHSHVFGAHLKSLADPNNLPSVAHCTGGKDRAGFAAAITLLALGVPESTVVEDFLKTNVYTQAKINKYVWMIRLGSLFRTDPEKVRPLLGVEEAYIRAALDTIKQDYGSFENYWRQGLGISDVEMAAIRRNLLEG